MSDFITAQRYIIEIISCSKNAEDRFELKIFSRKFVNHHSLHRPIYTVNKMN